MQVVDHQSASGDVDLGHKRNSSSESFLERLGTRGETSGAAKSATAARNGSGVDLKWAISRQSPVHGMPEMPFRPLDELLELAAEHIIHLQLASDRLGNIQSVRVSRVEIHVLHYQNVSFHADERVYFSGRVQVRSM
jgi:hypothetical protein